MIDQQYIGHRMPPHSAVVEHGRLKFFAKATGQTDPVYWDSEAAKAAGHADLLAPPTFAIVLALENDRSFALFDLLGVEIGRVLHGSQDFQYFAPIVAGDTLTYQDRIDNIFAKKGGALEFVIRKTEVTNQRGEKVVEMASTIVVRNG
ncbi:MaoC family dehydratase N-terminal domain-containing protein [Shimia biformata]|uniref:MaoC family dehydratase N-terminal domain-containing protein n=1 Tax=Shimia biformata TaxID=1294299 RepID=UPI0019510B88|nr:MaoC family dehydratase N-terminal domain-containing protein [Shimia biformata]